MKQNNSLNNALGLSYLRQTQTGQSSWWSWLIVFIITFAVWIIGQIILIAIVMPAFTKNADPNLYERYLDATTTQNQDALGAILGEMIGLNPLTFITFLLTFPIALTGLYIGQKLIHRRTLTSLHTAFKRFRFGRALQAALIIWGILAIGTLIAKALGAPVNYIFDSKRFLGFMIASLLFIPLQSATEEIVFRGYFNQALGHFIKNKWVVFTLTSLGFMALHLSNPE
ncbi:MAG: CPBP family glutamic-type intramembrane protease, partial [Litorimonas sp.]